MPKRGGNAQTTTVKEQATLAERRASALKLKIAGATYDAIARTLGYAHRGNAQRDVMAALAAITKEPAEQLKQLELERCDEMLLAIWPKVRRADLAAIDRALRIMERRAKYEGLDAPTRQTITVITEDMVDAEIHRLEAEMLEREQASATDA